MTVGFTNGSENGGFASYLSGNIAQAGVWSGIYGADVNSNTFGELLNGSKGITTDPNNSGIIVQPNTLNCIIKY